MSKSAIMLLLKNEIVCHRITYLIVEHMVMERFLFREESLQPRKEVGFFLHGYQPPREIVLFDGDKIDMVPFVNDKIHATCYRPLLVENEGIPKAVTFSFFGTLRDWMQKNYKQDFDRALQNINACADKEYKVLADPYLHVILPFLSPKDQDMMVKIGKQAFEEDLGFCPKGFWLPEAGVSASVLDALSANGYEFVVLKEDQLASNAGNPMFVKTRYGEIAVFHFSPHWSSKIAFDHGFTGYDNSGDSFLRLVRFLPGDCFSTGVDMETYGHQLPDRDKFLKYVASRETLKKYDLLPLDIKSRLEAWRGRKNGVENKVKENSSWSCEHNLGRWTGSCWCGCASEKDRQEKRELFGKFKNYQELIDSGLDKVRPEWRSEFISIFLKIRKPFFTGEDVYRALDFDDKIVRCLLIAKLYALIGMTSCGWFFDGEDRPERQVPRKMAKQIENLLFLG